MKPKSAHELANDLINRAKKRKGNIQKASGEVLKRLDKQQEYFDKYEKIIVTYHDNGTKDFTPDQWFVFENRVRKIAKDIEFIKKQ